MAENDKPVEAEVTLTPPEEAPPVTEPREPEAEREPRAAAEDVPAVEPVELKEPEQVEPVSLPPAKDRSAASPAPVTAAPARRGGFFPALFGGVLAAAGGFAVSHYNLLDLRRGPDPSAVEARLAALDDGLAAASKQAASSAKAAEEALALAQTPSQSQTDPAALTDLGDRLTKVEATLTQLGEVSSVDGGIPPAAFAALEAEVAELRKLGQASDPEETRKLIESELAAQSQAAIAAAEAEAAALKEAAEREAAEIAMKTAVTQGQPLAASLAALGVTEPPAVLQKYAETGLPSLAALQESFADHARAALEASLQVTGGDTFGDKAWSLLRQSTGARSLTPQEGADPDAVLSRAEEAVRQGNLPLALQELQGLPAEGQAEMKDWVQHVQDRIDAEAALAALIP